ncbi:hypothetical protein [uncultured Gemella sp.]|uniref:hypothetical protein n=1 Tax=uncultured Gemella sp. TaxID=254352 RepID=UPI0028D77B3D|nr:hypothetical protein [uncultured Gemella sp.]
MPRSLFFCDSGKSDESYINLSQNKIEGVKMVDAYMKYLEYDVIEYESYDAVKVLRDKVYIDI